MYSWTLLYQISVVKWMHATKKLRDVLEGSGSPCWRRPKMGSLIKRIPDKSEDIKLGSKENTKRKKKEYNFKLLLSSSSVLNCMK
jgi:hypothetical protein